MQIMMLPANPASMMGSSQIWYPQPMYRVGPLMTCLKWPVIPKWGHLDTSSLPCPLASHTQSQVYSSNQFCTPWTNASVSSLFEDEMKMFSPGVAPGNPPPLPNSNVQRPWSTCNRKCAFRIWLCLKSHCVFLIGCTVSVGHQRRYSRECIVNIRCSRNPGPFVPMLDPIVTCLCWMPQANHGESEIHWRWMLADHCAFSERPRLLRTDRMP